MVEKHIFEHIKAQKKGVYKKANNQPQVTYEAHTQTRHRHYTDWSIL